MTICRSCGRPDWCEPCKSGNPPANKLAELAGERNTQAARQVERVQGWLSEIPDLMVEVSHYITPGSAPLDPDARHGTTLAVIPIVAEVTDLLDDRDKDMSTDVLEENWFDGERRLGVFPTLAMWSALVYAELIDMGYQLDECCPRDQHTLMGEVRWLHRWCAEVMHLHGDFEREIKMIRRDLRTACRTRDPYIPTCSTCGFRMEPQYTEAENDDEESEAAPAWWKCTGCPRTVQHDAEVKRMALTQPPMTLRQIATFLSLPLRTLHNWATPPNARFLPVGTNTRGGKLFDIGSVERAAKRVGRVA